MKKIITCAGYHGTGSSLVISIYKNKEVTFIITLFFSILEYYFIFYTDGDLDR